MTIQELLLELIFGDLLYVCIAERQRRSTLTLML